MHVQNGTYAYDVKGFELIFFAFKQTGLLIGDINKKAALEANRSLPAGRLPILFDSVVADVHSEGHAFASSSRGLAKSPWLMRGQNAQHTGRVMKK